MDIYSVKQASAACGLSPCMLRIWEARYGWPCPRRHGNGYRFYAQHQIEDLQRVAELIRNGMAIGSIIVDGMPRWPSRPIARHRDRGLAEVRRLPRPGSSAAIRIQADVIQALEQRNGNGLQELLHRAIWQIRPRDEVLAVLAPILLGLEELTVDGIPTQRFSDLPLLVAERCRHLLRCFPAAGGLWIVPAGPRDLALAALAALVWNQRGRMVHLWSGSGSPTDRGVVVGDISALPRRPRSVVEHIEDVRQFCRREFAGSQDLALHGCA